MKTKFNLDRKPLDSSYIQSKQDFDKVINGYRAMKPPIWKNPWFYGPAGLASLALILTVTFQNNFFAHDNTSTLNTTQQINANQLPDDTPCIQPLQAESDVEFETFSIDAKIGGTITTTNGTVIRIAPRSLVAEKNVTVKVRGFQDPANVLWAGIPMDYGKKSAFESGGMIEIRGEQNGKPIAIHPDKPIQVDMQLYNAGADFKFWSLHEKTGDWSPYPCTFQTKNSTKTTKSSPLNSALAAVRNDIEKCEKNLVSLKTEDVNTSLLPEKNARKLVIEYDVKMFPELSGYTDLEFEYLLPAVRTETNMKQFEKSIRYASGQTWNDMDVSKTAGKYIVTFKNSQETYSIPVRPVLKGASLAQLEKQLENAKI